jgi:hypothetical protein
MVIVSTYGCGGWVDLVWSVLPGYCHYCWLAGVIPRFSIVARLFFSWCGLRVWLVVPR